ncbi:MAG: ribokinase [Microlunatus sp.]|nr:ribokinase [Microlunatus sp.]
MSGAAGQVVVFGSLNADLTVHVDRFPEPGETLSGSELVTAPGGKSSNQAATVAVLGSPARLIGAVGDDANGRFLLGRATVAGVDVSGVTTEAEHATGSAMIVVDAAGENTIIVSPGANGAHDPDTVDAEEFADAAVVCLCLEVPLRAVQAAAEHGRAAGAQVLVNLSPYADVPKQLLGLTDVLLVNRTEAALVLGRDDVGEDWSTALDGLVGLGVDRAVVTLGADGSVVLDATQTGDDRIAVVDPISVEVVDTTGCGDAFTGALAHRLAGGASLAEAARFAAQVSALAATAQGAQTSYTAFAHLKEPTRD